MKSNSASVSVLGKPAFLIQILTLEASLAVTSSLNTAGEIAIVYPRLLCGNLG